MILILAVTFFGLSSCTKKSQYSGDHPTLLIRIMWAGCLKAFEELNPLYPMSGVARHCDCLTDKAREHYKSEEYAENKGGLNAQFAKFGLQCIRELGKVQPTSST